jgi:hypothetical protein
MYPVLQDLQQQVDMLRRSPEGQQLAVLQNENAELRLELDMKQRQLVAAGGAAPQQVAARPLVAADLPALDAGACSECVAVLGSGQRSVTPEESPDMDFLIHGRVRQFCEHKLQDPARLRTARPACRRCQCCSPGLSYQLRCRLPLPQPAVPRQLARPFCSAPAVLAARRCSQWPALRTVLPTRPQQRPLRA